MYDMIIVGAGPAGLSAGLYAARSSMKVAIFERGLIGGQMAQTLEVENYPGYTQNDAFTLIEKMKSQAEGFGCTIFQKSISKIDFQNKIVYAGEESFKTKTIVLAMGSQPKKIGIVGEEEYGGRGVSYCATCDGAFFRDKTVAVIGGGNSAVEEGCFLTKFAKKVFIIHRRDTLRATKIVQQIAFDNRRIEFVFNSTPQKVLGNDVVEGIEIKDVKTDKSRILKVDGVFFYVGILANTEIVGKQIKKDDIGFLVVDRRMRTGIDGVFAAGDVLSKELRQVVTAVADGAVAAVEAEKYLGLTYR